MCNSMLYYLNTTTVMYIINYIMVKKKQVC